MGRKKSEPPVQWEKVGEATVPPLTEEEYLWGRLTYLFKRTERPKVRTAAGAVADAEPPIPSGGFVGDLDAAQRYADNTTRGRVAWQRANRAALSGLRALKQGNLEMAELYLRHAKDDMLEAYDVIVDDKQRARLGSSIKPAGRKPAQKPSPRAQRISDAMELQERQGLKGGAAFRAACEADADLAEECRRLSTEAAVAQVERLRAKKNPN